QGGVGGPGGGDGGSGWVYGGVGVGGSGGSGVRWRVGESGVDDWIDRSEGNKFGFVGKSPPEKISGGGSVVAAVAAAGGRWPVGVDSGERREVVCVCVIIFEMR
nr:hypothetical protein [Tanacetum cinerariifolium]